MMKKPCFLLSVALLLSLLSTSAAAKDFGYTVLEDGTASITRYAGKDEYVEIPDTLDGITVTSIDDELFLPEYVKTLAIPDTVTQIHGNPTLGILEDDLSLTHILVSETHPTLATIDGVLFSKPDKRLICYPSGRTDSSYEIPQGVEIIGEYAFFNPGNLTAISIPDSVKRIDNRAFTACSSLTSLTLPDGITDIGINPFWACKNLTAVRVTDHNLSLATIDGVLFHKQDKRLIWYPMSRSDASYAIPEGITSIGDYAFYGCESLASVTIPESVASIGDFAFNGCISLASITIPEGVTSIGGRVFLGCESLGSVTLPKGVTSIGPYAFSDCSSLTSITIPEGVTSIGAGAFARCTSLTSITIPEGMTSIDSYAFMGCSSLTSVTIPGSVTSIGAFAFNDTSLNLTMTAPEDSYAYQYALKNYIPCTAAEYPGAEYRETTSTDWLLP